MRRLLLASFSLSVLLFLPALPAAAQATSDVKFDRGTSGATLNGTLVCDEYVDYRLGAKGGQLMIAGIEDGRLQAARGDPVGPLRAPAGPRTRRTRPARSVSRGPL
ncbi:MAG: hypothetical protein MUF63_10480, partial [Rhodobacteraceae bacterium]|nr:hypothetical protein [Paracoccaceae bacterium]